MRWNKVVYLQNQSLGQILKFSFQTPIAVSQNDQRDKNGWDNFDVENVQDILDTANNDGFKRFGESHSSKCLSILSKLTLQGKADPKKIKGDPRFETLCTHFQSKLQHMPHYALLQGLRSLLELRVVENTSLLESVENEVLWKARKMSLKSLNYCLKFHTRFQEIEIQKKVVRELVLLIEKRWIDISDASDVLKLLENGNNFSKEFLTKVEERTLEISENMNMPEIVAMFSALSQQSRRPKSLLRALSYHLSHMSEKLSIRQSIDLFYALNILHFPDTTLLEKITNDSLSEIPTLTNVSHISAFFTNCGKMKWRHTALLEACCKWMSNHLSEVKSYHASSSILALARLNYTPNEMSTLTELLVAKIEPSSLTTDVWLDIVWSLCLLAKVNQEQLKSVLKASFYKPLIDLEGFSSYKNKLKMQNINAIAKLEFPSAELHSEDIIHHIETSEVDKNESKAILDALNIFMPTGKFLATKLNTNMGFLIDAEFIVNNDGKPISLVEYGIRAGLDRDLKPLPKNCHRFAILIWTFHDVTLNSIVASGTSSLAVRLLKKLDYRVIEIFPGEFDASLTTVKKVQFLQQKIKDEISKE